MIEKMVPEQYRETGDDKTGQIDNLDILSYEKNRLGNRRKIVYGIVQKKEKQ